MPRSALPLRILVASTDALELEWAARAVSDALPKGVPSMSSDPAVARAALRGEGANAVVLSLDMAGRCAEDAAPAVSGHAGQVPVAVLVPQASRGDAEAILALHGPAFRPARLVHADAESGRALLAAWLCGLSVAPLAFHGQLKRQADSYERRYEDLVHALPDLVYELDPDGRFTFLSDSVSMLGYRTDELIGQHFSVLFFGDDADAVDRNVVLTDYTGHKTGSTLSPKLFNERRGWDRRTSNLEVRLRRKPSPASPSQDLIGEVISYGEVSSAGEYPHRTGMQRASSGAESGPQAGVHEFLGSVGIIRDITLRRKSEEMLRKLYQAVDQLSSCVFVVNHAFEIEYVNPSFFLLTGFSPGDVLGKSVFRFFAFMPDAAESMRRHVQDGFDVRDEVLVPRARGGQFWAAFSISPVRSPSGLVTHAIAIVDDISGRKTMEDMLKSARAEAEAANHAKTSFLSSMTHELKNPISGIMTAAELLQMGPEDAPKRAAAIGDQARHLLDIITAILDYVRSEGGDGTMQRLSFPLKAFLENICAGFSRTAAAKGLAFTYAIPQGETLDGDPDRLGRAIGILLDNAIKYTESGSVSLDAEIERREGNVPHLVVTVRDTGIGIRQDDQDRIFLPFSRVGARRGVEGRGAGIGLALARNIVKVLGGEIRLHSEPGRGSQFTLIVPSGAPLSVPAERRDSPYIALVVDDNEVNLEYMRTLLENVGYRVLIASGAAEAFRILEARYVDTAVLDIQMPGYSGVELAKAIRAYAGTSYSANMPLFAMTAHDASDIEQADRLFSGVFTKPADIRKLAAAIDAALEERETVSTVYFNASYPGQAGERQAALSALQLSTEMALDLLDKALLGSGDSRVDVRAEAGKLTVAFQRFACPAGMDLVKQFLEHYAREDHAIILGLARRLRRMLEQAYRSASTGID